jgi:nicotinate-nucleotide pyrophosphorylase (carboxylating)
MKQSLDFSPAAIEALARSDVARALAEDIGTGDLTAGLIDAARQAHATVIAREDAVICGTAWVQAAMRQLDPLVELIWHINDGDRCTPGQVVFEIKGQARALLSAERVALNFLQLLSGVATQTARYVEAVQGTGVAIVDTRKTLPGLRLGQKYAVVTGGGTSHRVGLYDAILIKENHIAAAGGVVPALQRAAKVAAQANFVQIEIEQLEQLVDALEAGAQMILLDNMRLPHLKEAVRINHGRAILEISGGVSLDTVRALAETGVHRISIGALTKDVQAVDFSMRLST